MNVVKFTYENYIYKIRYKPTDIAPRCKYPKITVTQRIRTPNVIRMNYKENIVKEIIYPKELWFTLVEEDDLMEQKIIEIQELFPDWNEIEIEKIKLT